ncbi:MAG TPA: response regulator transcription factor [Rubrobacteraceae bacterium]|nr:response regulator transcription factor [Rubrobacteraceae bacterium]
MSRILLVDDHAWFRQAFGMVLGWETDFRVSTQAGSLAEARACLSADSLSADEAEEIDAAIIDLALPDGDGTDLIAEIGALREVTRRIPVMVLTATENPEIHARLRELGAVEVLSKSAFLEEILAAARRLGGKVKAMHKKQLVSDMVSGVLSRQAMVLSERTGEPFGVAMHAVLQTEAGRQLGKLRDGPHCDERAEQWQENLAPKRAKERRRTRREEHSRVLQEASWQLFMQSEMRDLELRKDGQLARVLDRMRGTTPAVPAVLRLVSEDQRQAEEGLVALTSGGKVSYKRLDDLTPEDRPARIASNRLRTTWLKQNQDGWLNHSEERL